MPALLVHVIQDGSSSPLVLRPHMAHLRQLLVAPAFGDQVHVLHVGGHVMANLEDISFEILLDAFGIQLRDLLLCHLKLYCRGGLLLQMVRPDREVLRLDVRHLQEAVLLRFLGVVPEICEEGFGDLYIL